MARLMHKRVGDVEILGVSLAGEETVVAAPEYNVCFDIGRAPREVISIDNVCLSHGHMDHAAGIAYYFSQRNFIGNAPGRVILHENLVAPITRLMQVWEEIERHPSPVTLVGVSPMQDVRLRRDLIVRAFDVRHGGEALGYTLIETRKKLKAEFSTKTGPQLVALKKDGVTIEDSIEVPLLTYTGDTAIGRWLQYDFVRTSRAVLVECTFFERDHLVRARAGNHIHVVELPQVCEAIPDAEILLIHVTRRTDLRLAKRILEKAVSPRDLERISFLMDRPPREKRPQTSPDASRSAAARSPDRAARA